MFHFVMAVNYTGQKYYEVDHCVHILHLLLYSSQYGCPIQCQTVKFWDWCYHKKICFGTPYSINWFLLLLWPAESSWKESSCSLISSAAV